MLVLTRFIGEVILVGDSIRIALVGVRGDRARIGVEAPPDVVILREELAEHIVCNGASPVASLVRPGDEPGSGRLRNALQMLARNATRLPDGGLAIRMGPDAAGRFRSLVEGELTAARGNANGKGVAR